MVGKKNTFKRSSSGKRNFLTTFLSVWKFLIWESSSGKTDHEYIRWIWILFKFIVGSCCSVWEFVVTGVCFRIEKEKWTFLCHQCNSTSTKTTKDSLDRSGNRSIIYQCLTLSKVKNRKILFTCQYFFKSDINFHSICSYYRNITKGNNKLMFLSAKMMDDIYGIIRNHQEPREFFIGVSHVSWKILTWSIAKYLEK